MNFAEMIESALEDSAKRHETDGLTGAQIVNRLTEAFHKLQEAHEFKPGQIVRLKLGKHSTFHTTDKPAIFMGKLDVPISGADLVREPADLTNHHVTQVADIVIAAWQRDSFVEFPAWSRDYEPHPDFQDTY